MHTQPSDRMARGFVIGGILGLVVSLAVGARFAPLMNLDAQSVRWATDQVRPHPAVRDFLLLVQTLAHPVMLYLLAALAVLAAALRHSGLRLRAAWAAGTLPACWILAGLSKLVLRRPRPELAEPITRLHGYAFPSGHAMNAAVVVSVLWLVFAPVAGPAGRRLAVIATVAFLALVAADRVLLGAHYPSDVVGGLLLGTGLVGLSWLVAVRLVRGRNRPERTAYLSRGK
ncbi:phosphatase PAP2 family protein [Calidifontibacter sp. DB0510]|uniref:Phosphatase PAP2 family protein n=1 Tax=Metallococcus carri TaxID=1656884 RepID=A0A967B4X5_9MICO|nr:phosphatase PAP2 family protein [Metallococcus carri]NHN54701.1 phosphatase PAP2 family protein [Metallococcus carri]NOP37046.1 phosphatase PAP2 family protein [Calidifontibacter sp. DB2511S]